MGLGTQLLATRGYHGIAALQVRYALVKNGKVMAEGVCAPGDLPYATEARAAFFSRNGYFDRVETEAINPRTLPFQARRIIEAAMAFNEPARVRFASTRIGAGRYRIDMAAAAESDIRVMLDMLPISNLPFSRLVLAETAIAALIGSQTDEPVNVLWMRGGVIIGALVEKGGVLAHFMDQPVLGESAEGFEVCERTERVQANVLAAARRLFPEREVTLALMLGELAGTDEAPGVDAPLRALEARLAQCISGAGGNAVLIWPELYGLAFVPACYSLLDPDYQEEALVSRYAVRAGAALLACGIAAAGAGAWQYSAWQRMQTEFAGRNARLDTDYIAVKKLLPSVAQLAMLAQRSPKPYGATDFRVDHFLAWVSRITPPGALIRRFNVSGNPPAATVEWEVMGDYASVEKLTAGLLLSLCARARLSDNKLEYKPGGNARFTTVLAPIAGFFEN